MKRIGLGSLLPAYLLAALIVLLWCGAAHAVPAGYVWCTGETDTCSPNVSSNIVIGTDPTNGGGPESFSAPIQVAAGDSVHCVPGAFGWTPPGGGWNVGCYQQPVATAPVTPTSPSGSASAGMRQTMLVLPDFLNLTAANGLAISVAILSAWGSAFAWKALVRALNVESGSRDFD